MGAKEKFATRRGRGAAGLSVYGGGMKTLIRLAALLAAVTTSVYAQTTADLVRDGNGGSTDNVLTYGMGYHQQR